MLSVLDLASRAGLNPKKMHRNGPRNSMEYWSSCPGCGGTDRFHLWPEHGESGSWWCRGCEKSGDAIQWLIEFEGMTFKEAASIVGKELTSQTRARTPHRPDPGESFIPLEASRAPASWSERAAQLSALCHDQLLGSPEQLAWLFDKRGINEATVRRFKLGWNPKPIYRPLEAWGLPPETREDGKPKMHWVPSGLVIPTEISGKTVRLRVRRDEIKPGEARYIAVKGSSSALSLINRAAGFYNHAVVLVESDLDALLLAQEVGRLVSVLCLTTAQKKPDSGVFDLLRASAASDILVATDADDAGDKAFSWWKGEFPTTAIRLRPDCGKDPGEMFTAGRNLREWLLGALPPVYRKQWEILDLESKKTEDKGAGVTCNPRTTGETRPGNIPANVYELAKLLTDHPVRIEKTGKRLEGLRLDYPESWKKPNWTTFGRISDLVFGDADCGLFIDTHPAIQISGRNYWQGWPEARPEEAYEAA